MKIPVTPTSSKSLTTLAFERLYTDILEGRLKPNERLRIQALSDAYKIGPTAIREALSRLTTNGLVELEDQRGFFVAPVSIDELRDLTATRIELESLALRLAIEKGGLEWEANLLSAFHRLSKTQVPSGPLHSVPQPEWIDWMAAHQRFHDALIEGCGSPSILRLCRLVLHQIERYRNLSSRNTSHMSRDTMAEHKALLDAVMARDVAQANKLMAEHFGRTAEIVERAVFAVPSVEGEAKVSKRKPRRALAA